MNWKTPLGFLIIFLAVALMIVSPAFAETCGVDAYDLTVNGNRITAHIKNTGCCTKPVYYTLYIDGGVVDSGELSIVSGGIRYYEKSFSFGYGTYDVKLVVTDRCATDTDRVQHTVLQPNSCSTCSCGSSCDGCDGTCNQCEERWTSEYRCVDGWKQRKYIESDCEAKWYNYEYVEDCDCIYDDHETCSTCTGSCTGTCSTCPGCAQSGVWNEGWMDQYRCSGSWIQRWFVSGSLGSWKDWEFCTDGCNNGKCVEKCDVTITGVDYDDRILPGERADIRVNVRNDANEEKVMNIALYAENQRVSYYSVWVNAGNTLVKDLFFYPDETMDFRIEVSSSCGGFDSATKTVRVIQPTTEIAYSPDNLPVDPEVSETIVSIYPDNLDIELEKSKTIIVDIRSAKVQDFTIDVAGVPDSWLSYDRRVGVDSGREMFYIYVTPRELGDNDIVVTVKAVTEGDTYKENIDIFVAKNVEVVKVNWMTTLWEMFYLTVTSIWFLLAIVVIILIIVVLVGTDSLQYNKQSEMY